MHEIRREVDAITNVSDMSLKKASLSRLFFDRDLDGVDWSIDTSGYHIVRAGMPVFEETFQHMEAVTKLMRIPVEMWLTWATGVVILAGRDEVGEIPLEERIALFKQSSDVTLKPYLQDDVQPQTRINFNCLNCRSKAYVKPLHRLFNNIPASILICQDCNLGMRYPKGEREDLTRLYDENYFSGGSTQVGYADYAQESDWRLKKAKNYLDEIKKIVRENPAATSALDIGAGYGYFLEALKGCEYRGLGIEVSSQAVDFAQRNYGVDIVKGDLLTLYNQGFLHLSEYGLITMWDVIEHFYDFNEELEVISRLLHPGGCVALRTNNIDSIEFQVLGEYFHSIKNEHTFYFTSRNLKDVFAKYGITPARVWSHTHLFLAFMSEEERRLIGDNCLGGDIFFVGIKDEKN